MLSKQRQQQIRSLVERLKSDATVRRDGDLWEAMTFAFHLFGDKVVGIEACFDESKQHGGLIYRNANVIADLLDNYLLEQIETNDYFDSTLQLLEPFTKAYGFYRAGLEKYRADIFERNTLDDMRLAFELLVKNITGEPKSLENQKGYLGRAIENAGAKQYVKDMFMKMLSSYMDYHNSIVKHQEDGEEIADVSSSEVSFMVEITSAFMRYLINVLGE
jgi:hypothetical protein